MILYLSLRQIMRCTGHALTFGMLLFATPSAVIAASAADSNLDSDQRFQQLERRFQQAQSPQQFSVVAAAYDELKESDKASASVLFNQANAWFRAGQFGRAIAGYRKALRISPRDASIRGNLDLALEKAGQKAAYRNAVDYAFFWKDQLSMTELATLISICLALVCGLYLLNKGSSLSRTACGLLAFAFIILIGSFVAKVNNEELTQHGVVVVQSVDARKGPASSYESAYSSDIGDGREFNVEDREQGWVKIYIEGSGSGWVPNSDVIVY